MSYYKNSFFYNKLAFYIFVQKPFFAAKLAQMRGICAPEKRMTFEIVDKRVYYTTLWYTLYTSYVYYRVYTTLYYITNQNIIV